MVATQDRLSLLTKEIQQKEDQIHMESIEVPVTVFETGSFVLVLPDFIRYGLAL